MIEHLGQFDFLEARDNVLLLGPPGIGSPPRDRLDPRLPEPASASATRWVTRLGYANTKTASKLSCGDSGSAR